MTDQIYFSPYHGWPLQIVINMTSTGRFAIALDHIYTSAWFISSDELKQSLPGWKDGLYMTKRLSELGPDESLGQENLIRVLNLIDALVEALPVEDVAISAFYDEDPDTEKSVWIDEKLEAHYRAKIAAQHRP